MCVSFLCWKKNAPYWAFGERLRGSTLPGHVARLCSSICPGTTLFICILIVWDAIMEIWMVCITPIDVVGWSFSSVNQPFASFLCSLDLLQKSPLRACWGMPTCSTFWKINCISLLEDIDCATGPPAFFNVYEQASKQTHTNTHTHESSFSCKSLIIQ